MNIIKLLPLFLLVGAPTLMALSQARLNEIGRFAKDTTALDIAKAEQYLNDVKAALPSAGRAAVGTLKQYQKQLEKKIVATRQVHIDDAKKEVAELKKITPAIPAADIKAIETVVNKADANQDEDKFLKALHENELFKAREAALRISKVAPSSAIHKTLRTPPPSLSLPIFTDKPIIKPGTPPPTIPLPVKPGTPVVAPSGLPLPIAPGTPAVFDPNMPLPPAPGTTQPAIAPTIPTQPPAATPTSGTPAGRISPTPEELQQIKLKKVDPTEKPAVQPAAAFLEEIRAGKKLKEVEQIGDKPAAQHSLKEQIVEASANLKEYQEYLKKMKDEATTSDNKLKGLEKALEPEKTKLATMKTAQVQKTAKITPTDIANQEKIVIDKKAEIEALNKNILSPQKVAIEKQEGFVDLKKNLVKDLNELFSLEKQTNKTEKDNARIETLKQIIELEKKDNLGTQDILQLKCLRDPKQCLSGKEEKQEQTEEEKEEWK